MRDLTDNPHNFNRVVIESLTPCVDNGRFPVKRAVGENLTVEADIFVDGHDRLSARLLYRIEGEKDWLAVSMSPMVNDRWQGSFTLTEIGLYEYTVEAWIDSFASWRERLGKKVAASQNVGVELLEGAELIRIALPIAEEEDSERLEFYASLLSSGIPYEERAREALSASLERIMAKYPDNFERSQYDFHLKVRSEPLKALYSTWYELFPRSCADKPALHGTFRDCIRHLPYIADMGFDVLYLPPIHPIGITHRKGRNNSVKAEQGDPGSPWAIGALEGGHMSVHPELGTLEDFRELIEAARAHDIDVAMDIAFQCTPDHPYVREHPEWFRWRPDGTVQYAENPPKKYQDIYPFEFSSPNAESLRVELLNVVLFWMKQGVTIFRVDNPHTKPMPFWEWLIDECKRRDPSVIFLAEAFTRPKIMYRLAKSGFTQSYTYFTWRNLKREIEQYFEELTRTEVREFFWPNLWPNTPDILPEFLQLGGRPAFQIRLALAATLSASYGIYGPAFELCVSQPKDSGGEEYMNSEKYEIVSWDLNAPHSLRPFITRINRIRHENPALWQTRNLLFHPVECEEILCFSKFTDDLSNMIVVAVNLDPNHTHSAWLRLPFEEIGLKREPTYQMHELVSDARYLWHGELNYVELNPSISPVQIFRVRHRVRRESDFDYFM